jgi:tRNA(fMet)-specific endonuclease VapC
LSYSLDTVTCIRIMSGKFSAERERFQRLAQTFKMHISSIVLFELEYGVAKSDFHAKSALRLERFLLYPIEVMTFDGEDAAAAGRIRATLESRKEPIGRYDTLIAGQALARGLTLVTANHREFSRVEGLKWEDWSA